MLLPDTLHHHAQYAPSKTALKIAGAGEGITYSRCRAVAEKLAGALETRFDVRKGDRVAVLSFNSLEHFFLLFAARITGFILVPLNYRLSPPELSAIIQEIEPRLLICSADFEHVAKQIDGFGEDLLPKSIVLEMGAGHGFDGLMAEREGISGTVGLGAADPAMLLYTSGSEGHPKGVVVTHGMLQWNAINANLRLDLSAEDVPLVPLPLYHTGGWNVLATPLLFRGGTVILQQKFDPGGVLRLIASGEVTLLVAVPSMLRRLAAHENFHRTSFSSLRYIIVGGEPVTERLFDIWQEKGVPLRPSFGMTEACPGCFTVPLNAGPQKATSVGVPNICLDVRLIDTDGREVSDGETGELALAGPVVTPGYWKGPGKTEPATRDGWLYTGDLMRRDPDGYFHIAGRKKDLFISGGENIMPLEIENVLREHPGVVDAAVVAVDDDTWGETGVAFVVVDGNAASTESLAAFCRARLAAYKVPSKIRFLKEFPRTPLGKLDRHALKLEAASRPSETPER